MSNDTTEKLLERLAIALEEQVTLTHGAVRGLFRKLEALELKVSLNHEEIKSLSDPPEIALKKYSRRQLDIARRDKYIEEGCPLPGTYPVGTSGVSLDEDGVTARLSKRHLLALALSAAGGGAGIYHLITRLIGH